MHIAIDVREACRAERAGKGRWTRAFVDALLQRDVPVTLFTDAPLPAAWMRLHEREPQRIRILSYPGGLLWHVRVAFHLLRHADGALYVSTVSYIVPFLVGRRRRVIPVIHDLIALLDDTHDRRAARIERWTLPRAVRTAWRVCTVSDATKNDLLERFPSADPRRVHVIGAAATNDAPMTAEPDGRTVLSVGTLCPRKNQLRLIEAFARLPAALRARHRLVLVGGRGWGDAAIVRRVREVENVEWLGYQTDDAVRQLLSRATVCAYPSLYEGFGLPVLDAMRAGIPVLCSDRGSLAEVAGDAALLVDPERIEAIRDGLERLLSDGALRNRLILRGKEQAACFSWESVVDRFLSVLYD